MTDVDAMQRALAELDSEIVVTDPDITVSYSRDQSRFTRAEAPGAVLLPRTTADVSHCMQVAHRYGIPVVPRGAGSGLSGGANATAGSWVISLHRMCDILEINAADQIAVVQPGVVTATLRAEAKAVGLFYPPDPGSVEISTIGGNVATNAGGMCCLRYGVTSDFVMGLEVVLADGRVLRAGRRTVKGVAGYDLPGLFVGSEGTLGIITEVTVRLLRRQPPTRTLVGSFARLADAGRVVAEVQRTSFSPTLMEILDHTTIQAVDDMTNMNIGTDVHALLLVQCDEKEQDDLEVVQKICMTHGAVDVAISADEKEGELLLQARRLALPALERFGDWLLDDVAVPLSRVVDLIEAIEEISSRLSVKVGVFGHVGDGNLHPTIIYDHADAESRAAAWRAFGEITRAALAMGGTITGEHGVGQLKAEMLPTEIGAIALSVHESIKSALDPTGIMNPGKVLTRP